jgi:hypothetical protein
MYPALQPAVCRNPSGMPPRQPEIGYSLGVHMQDIPRAVPSGPQPSGHASPQARAAPRLARGPMDIANKTSASPPVVTRIVSTPHSAPRFVVQLCQSTQPIDPQDVPQLDLFELYHLYCHSESRNGDIRHSLRLGYFKEPGHAKAIAAYLAPHFRHPRVAQIDAAEIISSLRRKFLPIKDIGASGQHAAVVLATPPPFPTQRHTEAAPIPAPNRGVGVRPWWSWLLDPLRRLHAATQ